MSKSGILRCIRPPATSLSPRPKSGGLSPVLQEKRCQRATGVTRGVAVCARFIGPCFRHCQQRVGKKCIILASLADSRCGPSRPQPESLPRVPPATPQRCPIRAILMMTCADAAADPPQLTLAGRPVKVRGAHPVPGRFAPPPSSRDCVRSHATRNGQAGFPVQHLRHPPRPYRGGAGR
jgi:hypothetical protein